MSLAPPPHDGFALLAEQRTRMHPREPSIIGLLHGHHEHRLLPDSYLEALKPK